MKKFVKIRKEDFADLKLEIKVNPQYPMEECNCIMCEMEREISGKIK